jgi:hypothetical protein
VLRARDGDELVAAQDFGLDVARLDGQRDERHVEVA